MNCGCGCSCSFCLERVFTDGEFTSCGLVGVVVALCVVVLVVALCVVVFLVSPSSNNISSNNTLPADDESSSEGSNVSAIMAAFESLLAILSASELVAILSAVVGVKMRLGNVGVDFGVAVFFANEEGRVHFLPSVEKKEVGVRFGFGLLGLKAA